MSDEIRHALKVIVIAFEMQFKTEAITWLTMFGIVMQPAIIGFIGLILLKDKGDPLYVLHAVLGSSLTGIWGSVLFTGAFDIQGERWNGTLEAIVGAPTPVEYIMIGKALSNVALGLLAMIATYTMGSLVLGLPIAIAHPLEFAVSVAFTVLAFMSLGLVLCPAFALRRFMGGMVNAFEYPIYILCGFMFPVVLLPLWTTPLSVVLPPYWAVKALLATGVADYTWLQLLSYWSMILLLSAATLALSRWLFKLVERRMRVEGSLGLQ